MLKKYKKQYSQNLMALIISMSLMLSGKVLSEQMRSAMKNKPDWIKLMEKAMTEELAKVLQEIDEDTEGETNG